MDEDLTIQLLKDVLALHGLAGYGGDYTSSVMRRLTNQKEDE